MALNSLLVLMCRTLRNYTLTHSLLIDDEFANLCSLDRHNMFTETGGLFTNAGRTYDTTAVVRRGSQLRYDLFTKLVASVDRIVRTIRPFADRKCRSITIVYISICGADR